MHVQTEGRSECGGMGFTEEEREEEEVVTAEVQAGVDNFRENMTQLQVSEKGRREQGNGGGGGVG